MFSDKEMRGNLFIYCIFQISNICLAVLGLFTFGIAIYVMVITKGINILSFIFFCFGIFLMILSYFGCKLRNAPIGNLIYTLILLLIFLLDVIVTIISFVDRDKTIDYVMNKYEVEIEARENIKNVLMRNLNIVNDLLLIILLILFLVVVLSWWYRKSLLERQIEWNKSLIDEQIMADYEMRRMDKK